jgi:bifunctional non-homologous end joining protein LigD
VIQSYRPGRNGDALKIKCIQGESFVVIGDEPSTSMRRYRKLVPGCSGGNGMIHVGSVGTGFRHQQARDLKKQLDTIKVDKPAAPIKEKGLVFVAPDTVAEIEFRVGWRTGSSGTHCSRGYRNRPTPMPFFGSMINYRQLFSELAWRQSRDFGCRGERPLIVSRALKCLPVSRVAIPQRI